MGFEEALVAVPMVILVVYVGWVILQALATSSPGFMAVAILLMIAIIFTGIAAVMKALS